MGYIDREARIVRQGDDSEESRLTQVAGKVLQVVRYNLGGQIADELNLTNLTRLTVSAFWLPEDECVQLFAQHRCFAHLRCLELIEQYTGSQYLCPQTDVALMPFVKPAAIITPGRTERQRVRAAKRRRHGTEEETDFRGVEAEDQRIPEDNASNFPALECLALPYTYYNRGGNSGEVSVWMKSQLRRSYEYEISVEWEAETSTLGQAELLKSIT